MFYVFYAGNNHKTHQRKNETGNSKKFRDMKQGRLKFRIESEGKPNSNEALARNVKHGSSKASTFKNI